MDLHTQQWRGIRDALLVYPDAALNGPEETIALARGALAALR